MKRCSWAVAALALICGSSPGRAQPAPIIHHQSFYVGGAYSGPDDARVMGGQMYVEALTPARVTHPWPLVLIHGLAQTAMNWTTTPDGREGWAEWFAAHGYKVYMVDQPARGRSAWQPNSDGALKPVPTSLIERLFTAPEDSGTWPSAKLHTQWPGGAHKGHAGDPVFDQFYASQVPSLGNAESETLMQKAGVALLDRIGPAILVVHSQAGLFGWLIADARPKLVKGIVALEPSGPPYKDSIFPTGADRAYGLTDIPLTYDPAVTSDSPLKFEQQPKPDSPGQAACWSQSGTPRRLPNLAGIPILITTTEASYHSVYDHCTSRYLTQAGVTNAFIPMASQGIHGNAHMMMLELNNLQIAGFLDRWMTSHIK